MKRYLCVLLVIHTTIAAFSQSDASIAGWKAQPVMIDGKLTEWNQPLRFYDADTRLFFDIANDSSNIYLCFESRDETTQMKLMRAGMKLTLSTKGKIKHEASIAYPLPSKTTTPNTEQNSQDKEQNASDQSNPAIHDKSSFRAHFIQTHAAMQVEGFATAKGEMPLQNPSGVLAALDWDSASNLGYEVVIPQKEFFGAGYIATSISTTDITLTVEMNALPRSSSGSDDKHSRNYRNEGDGGMRRGQFNGGSYGSGNEHAQRQWNEEEKVSLNTKSSFKQKFILSKKD